MRKGLILCVLLLAGCAKGARMIIQPISFYDGAGVLHSIGRDKKPALVVFWIKNCGYCSRTMTILDDLRPRYPQDKLDMVGVYLNTGSTREVTRFAEEEGHKVPVAASRDGGQSLLETLVAAFGFTAPGRHVYLVEKTGKVHALETYPEVVQAVELATGLSPVEPAPAKPVVYSSERPG